MGNKLYEITKEDRVAYLKMKDELDESDVETAIYYEDYLDLSFDFNQYILEIVVEHELGTTNSDRGITSQHIKKYLTYYVKMLGKELTIPERITEDVGTHKLGCAVVALARMKSIKSVTTKISASRNEQVRLMNRLLVDFKMTYELNLDNELTYKDTRLGYKVLEKYYESEQHCKNKYARVTYKNAYTNIYYK